MAYIEYHVCAGVSFVVGISPGCAETDYFTCLLCPLDFVFIVSFSAVHAKIKSVSGKTRISTTIHPISKTKISRESLLFALLIHLESKKSKFSKIFSLI
jgi:hypothetical protein